MSEINNLNSQLDLILESQLAKFVFNKRYKLLINDPNFRGVSET